MGVSRATIKSAEENLKVARNRYSEGVGTNTVVLDAETLRTEAYSNYYSSVYKAVQQLMQLGRAVGDFAIADQSSFSNAPVDTNATETSSPEDNSDLSQIWNVPPLSAPPHQQADATQHGFFGPPPGPAH